VTLNGIVISGAATTAVQGPVARPERAKAMTWQLDYERIPWRKSTHSNLSNCVEVALGQPAVLVRDSKDPNGPVLTFSAAGWGVFLAGIRDRIFIAD
jgi:hypothetical protein